MLGSITVEKEIYACKSTQICIRLHIGEVILLCKSPYTRYYIFYAVKYFFLVHDNVLKGGAPLKIKL